MTDDELAIRQLVETWMSATKDGDIETVLDLMTDDVVFMVPGQKPFGKREFVLASEKMKGVQIDAASEIQEIKILGDWAYLRNFIQLAVEPPDGSSAVRRSGYTLTILRKGSDGIWRLSRDANLLAATQ